MEMTIFTATAVALVAVSLIVVSIVAGGSLHAYFEVRRGELEAKREANKIAAQKKDYNLDYSTKLLEFIRNIVVHIVAVRYNEFIDSHDITKVTEGQIKRLIDETASEANKSINSANINFDDALFDKDFYDKYIIEMVIDLVKQLTEKSVDKYIDG